VAVGKLRAVETDRGEYVGFTRRLKTQKAAVLLKQVVPELIIGLRFPRVMRWEGTGTRFARPIRWVVCLYGESVVRFAVAGVKSGDTTHVVPWLRRERYRVTGADHYLEVLRSAGICVDHGERRRTIESLARDAAERASVRVIDDRGLFDELTFMVESPRTLMGDFDKAYLELPSKVVTTAMRAHQRYLALETANGKLVPKFLTFTEGAVGSPDIVREGNEKVLRARLEDALFYWREDVKTGVDGLSSKLDAIVFIEGLGSLGDKARRLARLGLRVNEMMSPGDRLPEGQIERAALLAKADLASEMVKDGKEFTLLEGLIGSHYAKEAGESDDVVTAIGEHYQPRSPSDPLPKTTLGAVLSIADRVDTVSGCFIAGLIPTGSQDPYALRRGGAGLVRILEGLPGVSIEPLLEEAVGAYVETGFGGNEEPSAILSRLEAFFTARTEAFLKEHGIPYDVVGAVAAVAWSRPALALGWAQAIQNLRGDKAFELLITGAKRVGNILSPDMKLYGVGWGALEDGLFGGGSLAEGIHFEPKDFQDDTERALYDDVGRAAKRIAEFDSATDAGSILKVLSDLGRPIDDYFDDVLVNCSDESLRRNRHGFLAVIFALFSRYTDFSFIVEEGKDPSA
jgi:glycyl-tRNA synthetase beta chain